VKNRILFPDEKVIATEHFDVGQDWEVPIPGFFIIAARRKIISVADFTDDEAEEFIKLLRKIRIGMRKVLKIKHVYLFENEDTSHNIFHLWLFPRHAWMKKFGKKIQSVRSIIEYAKKNMTKKQELEQVKKAAAKMRAYMEKA
jgi:diadenosine tetraphosphate (Ap4A) HIT family hydrolase